MSLKMESCIQHLVGEGGGGRADWLSTGNPELDRVGLSSRSAVY